MISILPSTTIDQQEPITTKALSQSNELFTTTAEQTVEDRYQLDLALVQKKQQKYLINGNSKLSAYIQDGYPVTLRKNLTMLI